MPVAPDIVERARVDYAETSLSLKDIAARHGLSLARIAALQTEHGWPPRSSRRGRSTVRKRLSTSTPLAERRRLVRRLYAAITKKLGHLEDRMSSAEVPSTADAERETRALASLIRSVERVQELETDLTRAAGRSANAPGVDAEGPNADAERKRRELAERIRRIGEQIARGNAGSTGGASSG